jgi:hypothetical protein
MKNIIFVLILTILSITACNKLDLAPAGSITAPLFYQTEADATAAVSGVYSALTSGPDQPLYGRNFYFLTDMASDYATAGASAMNANVQAMGKLTYDASNDRIALAWTQLYRGISRANVAIENVPTVTGADATKTRLVNEAKFLRALLYFNAVRIWGDVPLVLGEAKSLSELKIGRTPKEEVYAQIIRDLTDAEALPRRADTDEGRATQGAAKALLAKVYLTRGEWQNAINKATEVIQGGDYGLFQNFVDAFQPVSKNGIEHIFSAQFESGQSGAVSTGNSLPACSVYSGYGLAFENPDIISDVRLFYDEVFEAGDVRKDVSYAAQLTNPADGAVTTYPKPLFVKYVDRSVPAIPASQNVAGVNFPVIRYADVLLARAEAENELNGPANAYADINAVRQRAGLGSLSGLSKEQFRTALQHERSVEFIQESQRWFDLVRWGTLVQEVSKVDIKKAVSARNILFPIPQAEVNAGLTQNAGY